MQEQLLIYGMYPSSVLAENDAVRRDFLWELVDSLLLKDILRFQEVKGSDLLLKLLRLLAFQIGSEVSLEELGKNLGISKNTVSRYLDLLEKSYIIFRLSGYSRNLRNEIKKMPKYYFYDIGVRNAVINNFNPISMRDDIGKLWENFALGERIKFCAYSQVRNNYYFWRTWEQQEIDLIEEAGDTLSAFEFKYSYVKPIAVPKKFRQAYPSANYEVISSDNIINFITNKR
jgi:predicted AAA+ superfamily ATPase